MNCKKTIPAPHRCQAVIFDMDGTLLYTIDDMTTAVNQAMCECGFPTHTAKQVETFVNHGARDLITRALPENRRDTQTVDRVLERYLAYYSEHVCEKTHPYTGIPEMLAALKQAGILLAVVSNKPDAHAKKLVAKLFPLNTFAYVSGSGGALPTKPDKACIDRALDALRITRREDVLYVGDSMVDVYTAQNGGLPFVGVLWGFAGAHSFDEAPNVSTASYPQDILRCIF